MKIYNKILCAILAISILCVSLSSCSVDSVLSQEDSDNHYISFDYGFTDVVVRDEETALLAISSVSEQIGISDISSELKLVGANTVDRNTYYRFQQYYDDIPVYGRSVIIVADENGNANALTSNYSGITQRLGSFQKIDESQINSTIAQFLETDTFYIYENDSLDNNLVVYNADKICAIAYNLTVADNKNIYTILMDAENGKILSSSELLSNTSSTVFSYERDASATGWQNDDGSYHLYNEEYNISIFDLNGINRTDENDQVIDHLDFTDYGIDTLYSETDEFDKDAVILLNYLTLVNDFYKSLGHSGHASVHAAINDSYWVENAAGGGAVRDGTFYTVIFIGQGTEIVLDLIGHEFTHSITKSIVGWHNAEEGLEEGYSDIFGELFEYYINGETDWVHGPRIIYNPYENNYPKNIDDNNNSGEKDTHAYSTVISHAAYLMWNGIDGNEVKKIDCDTLAELWYKSLFIMQSNTTFKQCANAITLTAAQMVRDGTLTPNQLQCILEAFDEVGIQNDKSYSVINSGATLTVNDIRLNPYDNYHLTVSEVTSLEDYMENKTLGDVVINTDISSEKGYALDLDPGRYCLRVKDNYENGSSNEFTKIITVIEPSVRNEFFPVSDSVTIFTDFGSLISAMTEYLGMTYSELIKFYGNNFSIFKSDYDDCGRIISYENETVPYDLTFIVEDYNAQSPDPNDKISEVSVSPLSQLSYSINGNLNTDITYSELCKAVNGTRWVDYARGYIYTYEYNNISVDFIYNKLPDESSTANTITVVADRNWEVGGGDNYIDWGSDKYKNYILYQSVIDEYANACSNNYGNDTYCYCSWAICDIDGDGTEELIIQDGVSEQGRTQHIYTIKNGKAVELGNYNAWHLVLYDDVKGDGKLVGVDGMSMSGNIYSITITDDTVTREIIKSFEDADEWPTYPNSIEFTEIYYSLVDVF